MRISSGNRAGCGGGMIQSGFWPQKNTKGHKKRIDWFFLCALLCSFAAKPDWDALVFRGYQMNPVRLDADKAVLVERADRLLKGFFAEAEGVADFFRQTAIMKRHPAAGFPQFGENEFARFRDATVTRAAER